MYDYHVHSNFSLDSRTDMEEVIIKAIDLGLKEIAFTDHIDYDFCSPDVTFDFDYKKYEEKIEDLRKKYGHKIKILKGVEMGIQPHIIDKCDKVIIKEDFDFVISSLHACDRKDIFNEDFYRDRSPREAYRKYFEEMLYCAKHFQHFNVIGHLNVLSRYDEGVRNEDLRNHYDVLEEIFKTLIEKGKGIEINTSGFRYGLNDIMPPIEVLKFYRDLGGEIITTGSDAHNPNHLALKFDYIYDLLRDIGFKYIATFEKRQIRFVKI